MSLFSELKRRNVIRVATAYVVGSWVIIQVCEATFPAFGFSDAALRLVIILLAIAFVPTVIFSWVFEITPQGLKREEDVVREHSITRFTGKKIDKIIMVLLAFGITLFAFDKFVLDPIRVERIAESARREGVEEAREEMRLERFDEKSVAVLPFANRSPAPEDAYFADGLHDELLTQLGRISALKVISRTSVEKFRDTDRTAPEIARELSVATILEGGVQRAGNQVRINVQLIDGRTDEHLWAETFDRELTAKNLFAIQSEVTSSIAEALHAELTPQQERQLYEQPTQNMEAYELYLRGRSLLPDRRTEKLRRALRAFEQAVELDPEFAQAWVGIAVANMLLREQGVISRQEAIENERRAVEKALELNDELGEAYASLAMIYWMEGDRNKAESAFQRAIELSPNYALAYMWYANFLSGAATYETSLALYFKAAGLDPHSRIITHNIAGLLSAMGREDEAQEYYEQLLQFDDLPAHTYADIGRFHASQGRLAEAMKWYRQAESVDPLGASGMMGVTDVYIALDDLDALQAYRDRIADVQASDSPVLLYIDFYINLMRSGWEASLMLDELSEDAERHPMVHRGRTLAYLIGGQHEAALEQWFQAEPGWADPEHWPQMITEQNGGCYTAMMLIGAGEVSSGQALVRQSLTYLENELPRYVQHMDRYWNLGLCYLLDGRHEKALDFFEQYVAHGHWGDWHWSYLRYLPCWEPVRENHRYIALMKRIEELQAEQRELIRQLDNPALAVD